MEQLKWICTYCGTVFTHHPVNTDDGRPCCSTGCANYLNSERSRASNPLPNVVRALVARKKKRKSA